jgi:hypothetical protein
MPDLPSSPGANRVGGRQRGSTPSVPRWVTMVVIVFIILVVLFVILHLTGNGFGQHMHMSALEQGIGRL